MRAARQQPQRSAGGSPPLFYRFSLEVLERVQDGRRATARRRPPSSGSSRPRSASPRGPASRCAPSQQVPSSWTRRTTSRVVSSSSPKRTRTWLRTTSFRISTPGSAPSSSTRSVRAWSQQRSTSSATPLAAERAERRPDGEAARAAGRLRHPVGRAAAVRRAGDSSRRPPSPRRARPDAGRRRRRSRRARSATCARRSPRSPRARPRRPGAGSAGWRRPTGRTRRRRAARRPAPSHASAISANGSNAPVLTLPA